MYAKASTTDDKSGENRKSTKGVRTRKRGSTNSVED